MEYNKQKKYYKGNDDLLHYKIYNISKIFFYIRYRWVEISLIDFDENFTIIHIDFWEKSRFFFVNTR